MGGFSLIHWLILGVVILLLFGGNRFSSMMGDVAKGLKSFKQGMTDEDPLHRPAEPRALPPQQGQLPPQAYTPPPIEAASNRLPGAHPDAVSTNPDVPPAESMPPSPPRGVPPGGEPTS
ncbi:MAG: twin-arginine translocase TatA/TatE family subunit [Sphingomicrobium sp.]